MMAGYIPYCWWLAHNIRIIVHYMLVLVLDTHCVAVYHVSIFCLICIHIYIYIRICIYIHMCQIVGNTWLVFSTFHTPYDIQFCMYMHRYRCVSYTIRCAIDEFLSSTAVMTSPRHIIASTYTFGQAVSCSLLHNNGDMTILLPSPQLPWYIVFIHIVVAIVWGDGYTIIHNDN